jgi:protein-glutamine gamma-glutamyltransferase
MSRTAVLPGTDRQSLELLLWTLLLVAAPHVFNLAGTVMGFYAALVLWRLANLRGWLPLPARLWLLALTAAGAGLVYLEYHRLYGREGGAALFTVGLALKLMELKSPRDVYLAVFLAFFVAVTQYLFSQSIPMAAYTLAIVVLLVACLISLNSSPYFVPRQRLKLAVILVTQALPVMVVLFIFIPRIAGPLWALPDENLAKTGLGETIEPGSISRLGLSQEAAFRVDFEGPLPPRAERYWRGPVFWNTDGARWSLPPETGSQPARPPRFSGSTYRYAITLEPHQRQWVFALELPDQWPAELRQTEAFLLLARDKISERRRYRLASRTEYSTGEISEQDKHRGLQLPKRIAPRVKALAESWKAESANPAATVDRALQYFREQPFFYTLSPPLIPGDPVDGFLFETRRGFCEHYATAFTVLMRLAGIPARVVTGYQGGQWNAMGKFLEIRQADAHAWSEVWLAERGWTRIDPTAAVAPERIERGVDVETQIESGEIRFNPLEGRLPGGVFKMAEVWRQSRMLWAGVDHAWDLWVLAYGPENQTKLLSRLGISDWKALGAWLFGSMSLILSLTWLFMSRHRPVRVDPALRIYQKFLAKLRAAGIDKHASEGPTDFARRSVSELPLASATIHGITALYLQIRYGPAGNPEKLKDFARLVRQFRIKPGP